MATTKLREPRPRKKPLPSRFYSFPFLSVITLPRPILRNAPQFYKVLASRHSRRNFETPLTSQQLGDLLWHSARTREQRSAANPFWESRIAPSAGGCHPIHVAVLRHPDTKDLALIYDGRHHALGVVSAEGIVFTRALCEIAACLPIGRGTILWFLADMDRTTAKYRNPESLVWRDSGALLATISFVSQAMNLQACGLGIHETPTLRRIFRLPPSVVGVGGCIISGTSDVGA